MCNLEAMFLNLRDLYFFPAGKNVCKGLSHLQLCINSNTLGKVEQGEISVLDIFDPNWPGLGYFVRSKIDL